MISLRPFSAVIINSSASFISRFISAVKVLSDNVIIMFSRSFAAFFGWSRLILDNLDRELFETTFVKPNEI